MVADHNHPLLGGGRRLVIGHRGAALHAPENTIISMRTALEQGADALEIDVQLTSDGEPVVIHDDLVDRTTDGSGPVAAMSLSQLQLLDAGAHFGADAPLPFPYRERGIAVPALAEVLATFPDTPLVIELKNPLSGGAVLSELREFGALDRVIVASFHHGAVAPLRRAGVATGASERELTQWYFAALFGGGAGEHPFSAAFPPRRYAKLPLPLFPLLRGARRTGITLHTWVENDAIRARRLWARGVVGVVTDDPATLVRARGDRAGEES